MTILKLPLSKITFVFLLGILFAFYIEPKLETAYVILTLAFFALCISYFFSKRDFIQKNHFGIIAYSLYFWIGVTTQVINTDHYQETHYIHQTESSATSNLIELTVIKKLKNGIHNQRYIAKIKQINNIKSTGNILLNIKKNNPDNVINLPTGSNLLIKGTIIPHKEPYNPSQFDYGNYLKKKSILAQLYTSTDEIKVSNIIQKDILYYADFIRNKITNNLKEKGFNAAELNVVTALILGQQQDISPEILRDYQYAGAIHILSVSGLHVGFILLFLGFIMRPFPNTKYGLIVKLIIILFSLWIFAVITGLSPSVVRSATMFSFVAIGMHLKRYTNIYHTLIVSIFVILFIQPSFLFDVGFQLSYIALFFIVWLQPLLSKIWTPKNKLIKYFWDILTVSFAAQIGTLPLSIYYFHQFPGLFFVTNMIIIPLISVILALGIIVMILAVFNWVPVLPLKVLEYSIYILNKIINWIASFEDFIIKDIPFNYYMLIVSYLLIISFIIWFKVPSYNKLIISLLSIILFQVTCLNTKWHNEKTEEWIVFNMRRDNLIGERRGRGINIYCNDSLIKKVQDDLIIKSYVRDNFSSIKQIEIMGNVAYFNQKKILIIDKTGIHPNNIEADILVVIQSPQINLERIVKAVKPKLVIADASNYKSYISMWDATCKQQKIPFHSIDEKGFYRIYK